MAYRQVEPTGLDEHHEVWARSYVTLRELINGAFGQDVIDIEHVGSTAVPGLLAKAVIDIDLTVADPEDEGAYLPQLERVGFRLIFRDMIGSDVHRQLTLGSPNCNLHVWAPDAVEPRRHVLFREWLLVTPEDRTLYGETKRTAAGDTSSARYNDLKAAVVYDIYERAFAADNDHEHTPCPRPRN